MYHTPLLREQCGATRRESVAAKGSSQGTDIRADYSTYLFLFKRFRIDHSLRARSAEPTEREDNKDIALITKSPSPAVKQQGKGCLSPTHILRLLRRGSGDETVITASPFAVGPWLGELREACSTTTVGSERKTQGRDGVNHLSIIGGIKIYYFKS
jgi:hypothetical protein